MEVVEEEPTEQPKPLVAPIKEKPAEAETAVVPTQETYRKDVTKNFRSWRDNSPVYRHKPKVDSAVVEKKSSGGIFDNYMNVSNDPFH